MKSLYFLLILIISIIGYSCCDDILDAGVCSIQYIDIPAGQTISVYVIEKDSIISQTKDTIAVHQLDSGNNEISITFLEGSVFEIIAQPVNRIDIINDIMVERKGRCNRIYQFSFSFNGLRYDNYNVIMVNI